MIANKHVPKRVAAAAVIQDQEVNQRKLEPPTVQSLSLGLQPAQQKLRNRKRLRKVIKIQHTTYTAHVYLNSYSVQLTAHSLLTRDILSCMHLGEAREEIFDSGLNSPIILHRYNILPYVQNNGVPSLYFLP